MISNLKKKISYNIGSWIKPSHLLVDNMEIKSEIIIIRRIIIIIVIIIINDNNSNKDNNDNNSK